MHILTDLMSSSYLLQCDIVSLLKYLLTDHFPKYPLEIRLGVKPRSPVVAMVFVEIPADHAIPPQHWAKLSHSLGAFPSGRRPCEPVRKSHASQSIPKAYHGSPALLNLLKTKFLKFQASKLGTLIFIGKVEFLCHFNEVSFELFRVDTGMTWPHRSPSWCFQRPQTHASTSFPWYHNLTLAHIEEIAGHAF